MQHFQSDGVSIAYVDVPAAAGEAGEPVLLIHGFASTHVVNWVNPLWVKTLTEAGYRVVAFDNRGHGASDKPHDPAAYASATMAEDARRLLDHLDIISADVMGYSMGARITAFLALRHPGWVRSAILGGLGMHLVEGVGLPASIAEAMEAPALDILTDPMQRMFRAFADANHADRVALAACIRGSRDVLSSDEVRKLAMPILVAVGTKDPIAGSAAQLANLIPQGQALDIPGRDHNLAVGDKAFKAGVLAFLKARA